MILNHSPADILCKALTDLGFCSADSWPGFVNREPPSPDNVVTVFDSQGDDHGRTHPDGERQVHQGIQIRFRSTSPQEGYRKASEVRQGLDSLYQRSVTLDGSSYLVHSVNRTGEVLSLGREVPESKRSIYVINLYSVITRVS